MYRYAARTYARFGQINNAADNYLATVAVLF